MDHLEKAKQWKCERAILGFLHSFFLSLKIPRNEDPGCVIDGAGKGKDIGIGMDGGIFELLDALCEMAGNEGIAMLKFPSTRVKIQWH